jgi:hypothetical protein
MKAEKTNQEETAESQVVTGPQGSIHSGSECSPEEAAAVVGGATVPYEFE